MTKVTVYSMYLRGWHIVVEQNSFTFNKVCNALEMAKLFAAMKETYKIEISFIIEL